MNLLPLEISSFVGKNVFLALVEQIIRLFPLSTEINLHFKGKHLFEFPAYIIFLRIDYFAKMMSQ